jgi:hypothetical protein
VCLDGLVEECVELLAACQLIEAVLDLGLAL